MVLLDFSSLPHETLELGHGPSHLGHGMTLIYVANICSDDEDIAHVTPLHQAIVAFFHVHLTSCAFSSMIMEHTKKQKLQIAFAQIHIFGP